MEGKVTRLNISNNALTPYVNGDDVNLSFPDCYDGSNINQDDCFIPCTTSSGGGKIYVGGETWTWGGGTVGVRKSLSALPPGGSYGAITLRVNGAYNWDTFASSRYTGLQRIWLPRYTSNDKEGGFVDFYYIKFAYEYALDGNDSYVFISQDGSVYKSVISPDSLIVNAFGKVGKAGGGSYVPSLAHVAYGQPSISSEVLSISKHGEHIIL